MSRYAVDRTRTGGVTYTAEGRWIARVQVDGVRHTRSRLGPDTADGRAAAERMRRQLERDVRRGVAELRRGSRRWPLEALSAAAGVAPRQVAELVGRDTSGGERIRRVRLTDAEADQAATELGLHPAIVWPDWG